MSKRVKPIWKDGKIAEDSPNKTFCCAPFVHTYVSPQTERRLCCASREVHHFQRQYIDASNDKSTGKFKEVGTIADYQPITLKEHWNSPYMMDIRKKLMAGEKLDQCAVCNDSILSQSTYRQWFTGHLFNDKIDQCFEETDDDGYTRMDPISFDYRVSNLCNFKCRMCGEPLSSSWEAEKRKHDLWSPENQPFMVPENKKIIDKFQKEVVEEEFWEAICSGTVEELYWVGGEPLMYDIHWRAMDRLAQDDTLKNVHLRYNSNLSRVRFKDHYLYEWLPQAKDWTMCASIDGIGEIGEFIRTGLDWEQWDKNFREGVAIEGGKDRMLMDLTITGPGMFGLKDLFDYALALDVKIETKRMFAFHADVVFSPMAWPRDILDRIIDDILAYIKPRVTHKQQTLVRELEAMKNAPTFAEQWPNEYEEKFRQGRDWQNKISDIRKKESKLRIEDIYAADKELYMWWTRYMSPKEANFTNNWTNYDIPLWHELIKSVEMDTAEELHILELGVWEGRTSTWIADTLLDNPRSMLHGVDNGDKMDLAQRNIGTSKHPGRVVLHRQSTNEFFESNTHAFDIIYVDASHDFDSVISDGRNAANVLKDGGLLVFDDYKTEKDVKYACSELEKEWNLTPIKSTSITFNNKRAYTIENI